MMYSHHHATLLLACLAVLFFSGCQDKLAVNGGNQPKEKLEVVGDPPKVVVDEPIHEFGSMEVEQTDSHEFVIRNEGKGVLKLKKDRSTCKCTMADFDEAEVAPGESTKIRLEWVGKVLDQAFSQAAYIRTNDPDTEEIELRVQGEVVQTFDITPAGAWNLGEMNPREATKFSGMISSKIFDKFTAEEFECDNKLVSVKFENVSEDKKKELGIKHGIEIHGEVAPGSPVGKFSEMIKIKLRMKDEDKYAVFSLNGLYAGPLQIIGPAGWVASDMLLVMGRFPASEGKKVNLSLFLKDNTGEPLTATKIICEPEFLKAEFKRDEKFHAENRERYNLSIEVPPGAPSLVHEKNNPAKITIETGNPILDKLAIDVQLISY